jgi:hypothetical protein
MPFSCRGQEYRYVVGSDVQRDGMYLEVTDTQTEPDVLEVFYSDQTDQMTFTAYRWDIPLELVEWAVTLAKERLIPTAKR